VKRDYLRNIADIQTGPFGSQLHKDDYVKIGTPIVTVEHLGNRIFTEQNLPCVSNADKQRLSKYILKYGDIVFSRVGSVDRCSYVDEEHDGWMFSGRCLRVRPSKELDAMYLYYYFCTDWIKEYIRNIAVGATMPSINTKLLGEVLIDYPNIDEQRRIAGVLSAIDNKIEQNQRINNNLRQFRFIGQQPDSEQLCCERSAVA
jgi:type I restriction enzyme S subunit